MALTPAQLSLVQEVEVRMNEVTPQDGTPVAQPDMVWEHLKAASADLARIVPRALAYPLGSDISGTATATDVTAPGGAVVGERYALPDDFLRFFLAEAADWYRIVSFALDPGAPEYRAVQNPKSPASVMTPLAVLVPKDGGTGYALEVRPKPALGLTMLYVATATSADPEQMPTGLRDAMLWKATALTLAAIREYDAAAAARTLAGDAMNAVKTGLVGETD